MGENVNICTSSIVAVKAEPKDNDVIDCLFYFTNQNATLNVQMDKNKFFELTKTLNNDKIIQIVSAPFFLYIAKHHFLAILFIKNKELTVVCNFHKFTFPYSESLRVAISAEITNENLSYFFDDRIIILNPNNVIYAIQQPNAITLAAYLVPNITLPFIDTTNFDDICNILKQNSENYCFVTFKNGTFFYLKPALLYSISNSKSITYFINNESITFEIDKNGVPS